MRALENVERLKAELDALRPLSAEAERRVMQKFRLDWNYHSNKLEGNSLTFGETKALLLHGITAGTKPLKDYLEIKGHDEAIKWVEEVIKDETPFTEAFIRQLHTLILKEPYEIDAVTPDGKPTKRLVRIGEYKTQPNHVLTQTGDVFYFTEPFETPIKMRELVDWFRAEKEFAETNAVVLAATFHYSFIRIHPFDDGNGRVARILMNFILMQYGFPPVIIKTEDKQNYILALQQADAGIFEPFVEYIAVNLARSLETMIKGAKGESIEEPDDLDKELVMIERRLKAVSKNETFTRNREVLLEVFDKSLTPFMLELVATCNKFDKFYTSSKFIVITNRTSVSENGAAIIRARSVIDNSFGNIEGMSVTYKHFAFKQEGFGSFDFKLSFSVEFEASKYTLKSADSGLVVEKSYSEFLSESEIKELCSLAAQQHKIFIEEKIKEYDKSISY